MDSAGWVYRLRHADATYEMRRGKEITGLLRWSLFNPCPCVFTFQVERQAEILGILPLLRDLNMPLALG